MRASILHTACAIVLASIPFSAASADESGPLIELCKLYLALPQPTDGQVTADFIQLKSSCSGFINSHVKMSKPEDGFCVPKGYNMDDVSRAYMDWIEKHPDRVKEPTKVTMTAALIEKYPCPK